MRNIKIAPGEHYHLFNRAVNKQVIFHDVRDYARFLFLILYFQSEIKFPQIGRIVKEFVKSRAFDTGDEQEISKNRTVELVAFCIMPNHFHLIVKELEEGGIADYMQRVLTAYSKYYNVKYEKSGHVFQGPYRVVHIENDRQMLYLSAYVHRNPRELKGWLGREGSYPWSSYTDFVERNRWSKLLMPDIILGSFKGPEKYKKYLKTSMAKMIGDEFEYLSDL